MNRTIMLLSLGGSILVFLGIVLAFPAAALMVASGFGSMGHPNDSSDDAFAMGVFWLAVSCLTLGLIAWPIGITLRVRNARSGRRPTLPCVGALIMGVWVAADLTLGFVLWPRYVPIRFDLFVPPLVCGAGYCALLIAAAPQDLARRT